MPLASASVPIHLLRGAIGLLALIAGIVGASTVGAAALLLLVVTVVAWRGCPTCWAVGLMETMGRERACRDGSCGREPT
jgi:hypothetical protein